MDDTLSFILSTTYSLSQLKHRIRVMKTALEERLFGGNTSTSAAADSDWLKSLPDSFYQNFTKDNVYDLMSELEQAIAKLPVITMYLTFEPGDDTVMTIGTFARKTFNQNLLLDIRLDPKLIAGTALAWKGLYQDFSVRARIENHKTEIMEGFKKFLR